MKKEKLIRLLVSLIFTLIFGELYLIGKIYYYSRISDAQPADAIVVLGASQWNGKPSPVFQARLDTAYDLYENKFSEKIFLTGGIGEGEEIPEARSGKNYLKERGVQEDKMFMEEKGRTSKKSLDEVAHIMREKNINSVILVSDGFHMMRLREMANDLGIKAYISPVKDGPINKNKFSQVKSYMRESWVYVLYLIFGI
jgi:uncharacterized SAM-binding protein YcdF (DUF218 family)